MTTLRLAYREFEGFEVALSRQVANFAGVHPDVEVELVPFDVPALYAEMVIGEGCRSGRWDLFLTLSDWLPLLIRDKSLRPLNAQLSRNPPPDWPQGWSESVLRLQRDRAGTVFGLPYHDGPEMLMYREDLFANPAERAEFERAYGRPLAPPQTWSDFREIATFFTRPTENLYGCVVAAKPDGHNSVYDFLLQLWSRGGNLIDDGRPAFHGSVGQESLQWLTDLINVDRVTQPDARDYESVRAGEAFASGCAAMMWNWCGFAVVADLPDSAVRGKVRCVPLPRGDGPSDRSVSLSVNWVLAVPSGSTAPTTAWDFMASVATPEMDKLTAMSGCIGCRLSTWRDPEVRRLFPAYELIEDVHANVESLPAIAEYPQISEVLNDAIDRVHTKAESVATALDGAATQVADILAGGDA